MRSGSMGGGVNSVLQLSPGTVQITYGEHVEHVFLDSATRTGGGKSCTAGCTNASIHHGPTCCPTLLHATATLRPAENNVQVSTCHDAQHLIQLSLVTT